MDENERATERISSSLTAYSLVSFANYARDSPICGWDSLSFEYGRQRRLDFIE